MIPEQTQVFILAGGFGTRLKTVVQDVPKPMAPIAGRPFLEYLIRFQSQQGFRSICLMTGYMAQTISDFFGDGKCFGVNLTYSVEDSPLGTGGAIAKAMAAHPHEHSIVLNGDSFFGLDMKSFLDHSQSAATLALKAESDISRYGEVQLDENKNIIQFKEKTSVPKAGLINAGIYYLHQSIQEKFPQGPFSIEKDVFEKLSNSGALHGVVAQGPFIDIGIPESYQQAQTDIPKWILNNAKH